MILLLLSKMILDRSNYSTTLRIKEKLHITKSQTQLNVDSQSLHYFYLILNNFSFIGFCTVKLFLYLALILLLCEMWFAFDVLICIVYFVYALPSPLAAGGTVHFRFPILLQFFISAEGALS